jgi:hypothetical protein
MGPSLNLSLRSSLGGSSALQWYTEFDAMDHPYSPLLSVKEDAMIDHAHHQDMSTQGKCHNICSILSEYWTYVVTFAFCGHVLVMCMVDHGIFLDRQ